MTPSLLRIQAIRGFQEEQCIPLSPSLTVIYGENGRGKTSLCEGWNWLFTGKMLVGLEPQSELGAAGKNIHVGDVPRFVQLLDAEGNPLVTRSDDQYENPGNLPESTSPVLLQYRLNQVLFTSQGDRRKFFEQVMELDVEASFAQKLRRACLRIDPFTHDAWEAWKRAIASIEQHGFVPPHPLPSNPQEQRENEKALLGNVAGYLKAEPSPEGIDEVLERGSGPDIGIEALHSPISQSELQILEEAQSALDGLRAGAEQALARAAWQEKGFEFVQPPRCPFCNEATIHEGRLHEIEDEIRSIRISHSSHLKAELKVKAGIRVVQPLVGMDVDATHSHLVALRELLPELKVEMVEEIGSCIDDLDTAIEAMNEQRQEAEAIEGKDAFQSVASATIEVSRAWLKLVPHLENLGEALNARRVRARYMESAASIVQYYRADLDGFYGQLASRTILEEIAEIAPKTIERIKNDRLRKLALDIVHYYGILRPDDPTPLDLIEAAEGVRGDIRIMARSVDKIDHASALFSHSNSNALGMACHIARVLDAGHHTIVLDDPFQSLDDSNREYAVGDLIGSLLDDGLQIVVLTHERSTASRLLDTYADKGAMGTGLRWDTARGAIPEPMYGSADAQLSIVLDGFETDSLSDVVKANIALRQLLEGFCADYLRGIGAHLPSSHKRNLGRYIDCLEMLSPDVRPNQQTLRKLNDWNETLSGEAHFDGSSIEGINELKAITREALLARKQEKQLRPPNLDHWRQIPSSEVLKQRAQTILGP